MVDVIDRRVTRSLSSELQARAAQSSSYLRHDTSGYNPQHQNHFTHHGQSEAADSGLDYGVSGLNHTHMASSYMRNTSEEIFLNNLIDPAMVASSSGLEGLNFLDPLQPSNGAQAHRVNSEELFHSWITATTPMETANVGPSHNDSPGGHRTRRRISSELQAILAQQNGSNLYTHCDHVDDRAPLQTNPFLAEDMVVTDDSQSYRGNVPKKEAGEIGPADYSLSPFKNIPWFNSNSPMTRSRSSELRRRYAQMEGLPFPPSAEALQKLVTKGSYEVKPTVATLGAFARGINGGSPPQTSTSPPIPPSSRDHSQIQQPVEQQSNNLSAAISMLKGSIERQKLSCKQQQQQQQVVRMSIPQCGERQDGSPHMSNLPVDPTTGKQRHSDSGQTPSLGQPNILLNAHSPSGSSGGAPAHSAGITTSDGPSNSAMSAHRQALKRGNLSSVDQPSPKRHHCGFDVPSPNSNAQSNGDIYDGSITKSETRKKGGEHLSRAGSITSSVRSGFQVSDIDDATKRRRVERQKKMAEQKEKGRGNAPPMPADLQAAVKRCDTLEKEVRSLKLNLSFMNRKDSEQTKRIEELEKQNEDLQEEKDKLLEELGRFNSMIDTSGTP